MLDMDDFEDIFAYSIQYRSTMHRLELKMIETLIKMFNIDLVLQYEYTDFNIVFPADYLEKYPQLELLKDYKWCSFSPHALEVIAFTTAATRLEKVSS